MFARDLMMLPISFSAKNYQAVFYMPMVLKPSCTSAIIALTMKVSIYTVTFEKLGKSHLIPWNNFHSLFFKGIIVGSK